MERIQAQTGQDKIKITQVVAEVFKFKHQASTRSHYNECLASTFQFVREGVCELACEVESVRRFVACTVLRIVGWHTVHFRVP